jgi:hypothetical protein
MTLRPVLRRQPKRDVERFVKRRLARPLPLDQRGLGAVVIEY